MATTKPVIIKTKLNGEILGYIDETRNLLFTQYITTELAEHCGWSWREQHEQLKEAKHGEL